MNSCTRFTFILGIAGALLAGCSTRNGSAAPRTSDEALIPPSQVAAVTKGMSGTQVRALLGRPLQVKPFPSEGVQAEVWVYRTAVHEVTTMVTTSTRLIPTFDFVQNAPTTGPEQVYQQQVVRTYRTLELLMVDGWLTELKSGQEVERHFY